MGPQWCPTELKCLTSVDGHQTADAFHRSHSSRPAKLEAVVGVPKKLSNASPHGADDLHASAHQGAIPIASPCGGSGFRLRASSCGAKLVTRRAPMRSASALDLDAGDEAIEMRRCCGRRTACGKNKKRFSRAVGRSRAPSRAPGRKRERLSGRAQCARSVTSNLYQASDSKATS